MKKYLCAVIGGIIGFFVGYMLGVFISSSVIGFNELEKGLVLLTCVILSTIFGAGTGWCYGDK